MSLGASYLLLLGSLVVFVIGVWQADRGWAQRGEAARRARLERGDPARRPLRAALDARLRRTGSGRAFDAWLVAAGVQIGPSGFLLLAGAATATAAAFATALFGRVLGVLVALAAPVACNRAVALARERRAGQFVAQLPELARILSNAASAGLSLPRAVEVAAAEVGPPAADVLQRVIDELRVGQSVERALENLQVRLPSREVGVLVSTLVIQQRAGGDVVAVLRDIAGTLEARKDLRRELRTVMAGAVTTGYVVIGVGLGSLLLLNAISPGVLERMTQVGIGRLGLAVGFGLFAVGFLLIRRTTRIPL